MTAQGLQGSVKGKTAWNCNLNPPMHRRPRPGEVRVNLIAAQIDLVNAAHVNLQHHASAPRGHAPTASAARRGSSGAGGRRGVTDAVPDDVDISSQAVPAAAVARRRG